MAEDIHTTLQIYANMLMVWMLTMFDDVRFLLDAFWDLLGIVIVDGLLPNGCAGGGAAAGGGGGGGGRGCKLVSHFEEERLQKTSLNAS